MVDSFHSAVGLLLDHQDQNSSYVIQYLSLIMEHAFTSDHLFLESNWVTAESTSSQLSCHNTLKNKSNSHCNMIIVQCTWPFHITDDLVLTLSVSAGADSILPAV